MTETIRVLALGDGLLRDALLSRRDGGQHLDRGLAEVVAEGFGGCTVDTRYERCHGVGGLRSALQNSASTDAFGIDETAPDVVVVNVADDVIGLPERASDPGQAMLSFREDLIAVIDEIKERAGAHVLLCNVSTFDPSDNTSNFSGRDPEPFPMRAHRVDLALLNISHLLGVSLIDVDRLTAEAGCETVVPASCELSPAGSALLRDETARVLADYGFFDARPLVAQVGNRGGDR